GHILTLGELEESSRALAQLRNPARRGRDRIRVHGLDRVDNDEDRVDPADRFDDRAEVGLGEDENSIARDSESARAHLDLRCRLLARDIENVALRGQRRRRLHQERALADPGIAAQQHARPLNDPAAEHPVELADTGDHPLFRVAWDIRERDGRSRRARETMPLRWRDDALLDERVPPIARRAAPDPFRRLEPALLADERGLRTRGHPSKYRPELDLSGTCAGLAAWTSTRTCCTSPSGGSTWPRWRPHSAVP